MKQRLAAILVADVAAYSRLMAADENATVAALDAGRAVFRKHVESNQGRVIDMAGDSVLAVFETAAGAVNAALAIQEKLSHSVGTEPEERALRFRIGIHLGDVIEKSDGTVYGDGVNIAARLEGLAAPGGVAVSDAVKSALRGKANAVFEDLGDQLVKNIAEPVRVYRVQTGTVGPESKPVAAASWEKPSIAVLPFANLSGDPEQDYFADGMTEDIITELSRYGDLSVIARNSVFTFRGTRQDITRISRDLSAQFILEGSIRRVGDRLRISVKLSEGATAKQVWAERYDRTIQDIFATQDEIAQQIVGSIAPQINYTAREGLRAQAFGALDSYDAALRASALVWRGWDNADVEMISRGIAIAEQALKSDPRCQRALAILAIGCQARAEFQPFIEERDLDAAFAAARRLHELDSNNHAAWLVLGIVAIRRQEHDKALASLRRGHELNPNDVLMLRSLAWEESNWALGQEALAHARRALQLSPRDPSLEWIYYVLGMAAYVAGDLRAAIEYGHQRLVLNPANTQHNGILVASLAEHGDLDEARQLLEAAYRDKPDYVISRLRGKNYFAVPDLGKRYVAALRKAAGNLVAQWGIDS
jgi:adenylate cyclase